MPDISLITSLYRTDAHLASFSRRLRQIAQQAYQRGLQIEFVLIANDASAIERALLDRLQADLDMVQVHHTPLESVYASWNRGVAQVQAEVLGFWNVDDRRRIHALLEGYLLIAGRGYDIVDFPTRYHVSRRLGGRYTKPAQYKHYPIHPRNGTSPFFMFKRDLYQRAGNFDAHFKIAGDFEWCMRQAVRHSRIGYGAQIGGTFVVHGDNLSVGDQLWVEFNVVLLRHGNYDALRPVEPEAMRHAWYTWGRNADQELPPAISQWLWGTGAESRYYRYKWERDLPPFARRVMLSLAKRGIVHSVDWETHHGTR
jgi:hypothetical protein